MFDFNTTQGYFVHLISTALKDEQPQEKPENVSFSDVYSLAQKQNVANLVWYSINKLKNPPDDDIVHEWKQTYAKALNKCATQEIELEILVDALTSAGYDVIPLKGSVIRKYYPVSDMRTMTDIDLLVKAENREPIRQILQSLGYKCSVPDDGQVDSFEKLPIMAIDIHYALMAEVHKFHEHFQDVWTNAVATKQKGVYAMTFEDMYVYNIGHYAKHMFSKGTGIRCILDSFVLWNTANGVQKENIISLLKKKGLYTFNEQLIKIANIWINDAPDDGSLDDVQAYFINMPTYGDDNNTAIKFLDSEENFKISKFKHLFKRLFPSADLLYTRFNIKYRNPILLPFLWIKRLFIEAFERKKLTTQILNTTSFSESENRNTHEIYEKLGLI
jgi:hypothetical protein